MMCCLIEISNNEIVGWIIAKDQTQLLAKVEANLRTAQSGAALTVAAIWLREQQTKPRLIRGQHYIPGDFLLLVG